MYYVYSCKVCTETCVGLEMRILVEVPVIFKIGVGKVGPITRQYTRITAPNTAQVLWVTMPGRYKGRTHVCTRPRVCIHTCRFGRFSAPTCTRTLCLHARKGNIIQQPRQSRLYLPLPKLRLKPRDFCVLARESGLIPAPLRFPVQTEPVLRLLRLLRLLQDGRRPSGVGEPLELPCEAQSDL